MADDIIMIKTTKNGYYDNGINADNSAQNNSNINMIIIRTLKRVKN